MRTSAASDRWLAYRRPRPGARVRLFCFPHAGGGASLFHGWADRLPPAVEVCPVQFPGRETRFGETPFTRLGPLVCALVEALLPHLDRPFAFFGHSLGALLGFELARRLRRERRLEPVRLFASACAAPQGWGGGSALHALPDAAFRKELRRLGGTPPAVLDNEELMAILLPALRADFALCETYAYTEDEPLSCPITALGGLRDRIVSPARLGAWRRQTTGEFRLQMLPGDHFFPQTDPESLLAVLGRELAPETARLTVRPVAPADSWRRTPPPPLGGGQVHVWRVSLDAPAAPKDRLRQTLSADEERKAAGFRFAEDRERYVACRGALRAILARYLHRRPEDFCFSYNPEGKPFLAGDCGAERLRFNVAHADGLALVALAREREVGVDLERVRAIEAEEIAERFFSAAEVAVLRGLPADRRVDAFFRCWTRKEAYLKATGKGLSGGLDQFDVSLAPGEPAALLAHRGAPAEVGRWRLRELAPAPGYAGALAVEGPSPSVWCGDWDGRAVAAVGSPPMRPPFVGAEPRDAAWGRGEI